MEAESLGDMKVSLGGSVEHGGTNIGVELHGSSPELSLEDSSAERSLSSTEELAVKESECRLDPSNRIQSGIQEDVFELINDSISGEMEGVGTISILGESFLWAESNFVTDSSDLDMKTFPAFASASGFNGFEASDIQAHRSYPLDLSTHTDGLEYSLHPLGISDQSIFNAQLQMFDSPWAEYNENEPEARHLNFYKSGSQSASNQSNSHQTFISQSALSETLQFSSFNGFQIPRPFICTAKNCTKSYKRRYELQRHQRIHSGVRSHTCRFVPCHRGGQNGFARKDHLRQHLRQVHGVSS